MNEQIANLVQQIRKLEDELSLLLKKQEQDILYRVNGTRIEFEKKLKKAHRKLKVGVFRWLRSSKLYNVLSAPFIYGMIVPFLILDGGLTLFQAICFRLYHIPRVSRADYIVFDRHHLGYLNFIEKINCTYCAYAVGLIAYAREITARTEQYWCPIKHAGKLRHPNQRDLYFIPYGNGDAFHARQAEFRRALIQGDIPVITITDTENLAEKIDADKSK